jgi:ornithine cyclodeaminase
MTTVETRPERRGGRDLAANSPQAPSRVPGPDAGVAATPSLRTGFLGAGAAVRLVRSLGVQAVLEGMANRIEADFRRWESFDKKARVANRSSEGVIELMPISDGRTWSFKYVNGHPGNLRHARPTVMAFGALARVDNGQPEFVAELTLTTALRTAATSALAARWLARPGSRTMALIGNGAQAEFQALAFQRLLGIDTLRLYDTDAAATRKLMRNLRDSGFAMVACDDAGDACSGADIITTATADQRHATIVTASMVAPGTHLNAVGGDSPGKTELHPDVVAAADVYVEFEPQTRVEGEIQQMPAGFVVTELWRVMGGVAPGRKDEDAVTLFDSVGFALEDFSALQFMRREGCALGLVEAIDLIPALDDPKDLYALVAPGR